MTREKFSCSQLESQYNHLYCGVGYMSLNGDPRDRSRGTRAILAFAALFALLVVRIAVPDFPKPPSLHHSSISTVSDHGQRPHFDSERLQWSAPVTHFLPFPPAFESAHLIPTSQLWSALQTKGFHYNRPPPVS
jgi:hypothetical protein